MASLSEWLFLLFGTSHDPILLSSGNCYFILIHNSLLEVFGIAWMSSCLTSDLCDFFDLLLFSYIFTFLAETFPSRSTRSLRSLWRLAMVRAWRQWRLVVSLLLRRVWAARSPVRLFLTIDFGLITLNKLLESIQCIVSGKGLTGLVLVYSQGTTPGPRMEYKQLSSTTLEWSVLLSSLTHRQSGPVVHYSGNCISNCICHIVNGSNANCWCMVRTLQILSSGWTSRDRYSSQSHHRLLLW